jgi:hypothetical protein
MTLNLVPHPTRNAHRGMRATLTIAALAMLTSACSGGNDALPVITDPPTTTTTTTGEAPAVTDPAPSVASTLPAATDAPTTTTEPAPTTTLPLEDQIQAAIDEYFLAFFGCGRAPSECQPAEFTADQGPVRRILSEAMDEFVNRGLYFADSDGGAYAQVESISIDQLTVVALVCVFDAWTTLGPNGPDGLATVVNDEAKSFDYEYTLYFGAGVWRVGQQIKIEELGDGDLCG